MCLCLRRCSVSTSAAAVSARGCSSTKGRDSGAAGARPADPLSPEAPLIFAFSPLVGSPLTTSAKFAVVSRSPLTGRFNDSLASSGFAVAGKRSGCDAIVIVGRAQALSVLVIDDGEVRLETAADVAGDSCHVAEEKLRARLGADYRIASIGPAGERAVRYATISHDGRHAGRGGSGAVLGSKNIKAIAVRGTQRCEWAHPRELTELSRDLSKRSFGPATAKYRELGTATNLLTFNRFGTLPTRNFQSGTFEGAERISPEQLTTAHARTRASCVACTIGCEHIYSLGGGGVRLEYESLFALGSLCGVGDGDAVLRASQRCDELGIDTISTGGTIAFAMECVERGLLDEPWLSFGSGDAMLTAIELIGRREGVGQLLAEGSRRAAETIGQGSIAFAPQVKGLEIPGYEPRGLADDGARVRGRRTRRRSQSQRRLRRRFLGQGRSPARDARFGAPRHRHRGQSGADGLADPVQVPARRARGLPRRSRRHAARRHRLGRDGRRAPRHRPRIVAAKRQVNLLAGWTVEEDTLPERFLNTPLPNDPEATLSRERLQELVAEYHRQRGW